MLAGGHVLVWRLVAYHYCMLQLQRDSKLTRILKDSLGGNSKTSLIITASVSTYNYAETLSTIRFGARAKTVKNKPRVNEERSSAEYKKVQSLSVLAVFVNGPCCSCLVTVLGRNVPALYSSW